MASHSMVMSPIERALVESERILGKNRQWNAVNGEQRQLLNFYAFDELSRFSEKELRAWADWNADKLNKILRDENFQIQLQPFKPGEFGVVSILDVLVNWLVKGRVDKLLVGGRNVPAVKMNPMMETEDGRGVSMWQACASSQHNNPIARVNTKTGDKVYMTVADREYQDFALIGRIEEIRSDVQPSSYEHYDWLKFPMVDLNHQPNISWLLNMWTTLDSGNRAFISQALQQTKFKMNEHGARVKSAVAISVMITSVWRELGLEIDAPFFLWIERDGLSFPVMYAYIDVEDMKNPGDLTSM